MITTHPVRGHRLAAAALLAATVSLVAACSGQTTGTGVVEKPSATAAAVDACLSAAVQHNDFPLEDTDAADISVERDDQGWWSVRATVGDGADAQTIVCTAVPDDDDLARAASWGMEPAD